MCTGGKIDSGFVIVNAFLLVVVAAQQKSISHIYALPLLYRNIIRLGIFTYGILTIHFFPGFDQFFLFLIQNIDCGYSCTHDLCFGQK